MKKPYLVYKKYRATQKAILNSELEKSKVVCPGNCKFNQEVFFQERNVTIPMCTWGQFDNGKEVDTDKLVICSSNKQARECNTYSSRFPDEESVAMSIREKAINPEDKRKNYPELSVLEWVMDNDLHELKASSRKVGFLSRTLLWYINKLEDLLKKLNRNNNSVSENKN